MKFETIHVFDVMPLSINNYLTCNRGAASDFNWIKDIAERNTNLEKIEHSRVTYTTKGIAASLKNLFKPKKNLQ